MLAFCVALLNVNKVLLSEGFQLLHSLSSACTLTYLK